MGSRVQAGTATVTASGIVCWGRRYSLALAVREQWFEQAGREGEGSWQIPIYVELPEMKLYIRNGDSWLLCEPLAETQDNREHIESEIRKFSQLKQLWLERRKAGNNTRHRVYFPGKRTNR
ncbi:hypothetical protein [Paenibacillus koleovorans]|uniref:hypothetical protein n=1 Tax=Paenibacillus koleovorans TaxID=121608 RepID=UPI000FDA1E72|nr:hypothetical protein [Paenibacillus koleovorans]